MKNIRVAIADDHPLFRGGVARSLAEAGSFVVVGEAATRDEAIALARTAKPHILLLDLSMPGGGLDALRHIAVLPKAPKVAILTVSEEDDDVFQALKFGAVGYILKGIGAEELCRIIRDLAEGRSYVAPTLAIKVLATMRSPRSSNASADPIDTLTKREEEILRLVAHGQSNREIGRELEIQEKTVKHYMTAILQKLQVRNRTEAALKAKDHWR